MEPYLRNAIFQPMRRNCPERTKIACVSNKGGETKIWAGRQKPTECNWLAQGFLRLCKLMSTRSCVTLNKILNLSKLRFLICKVCTVRLLKESWWIFYSVIMKKKWSAPCFIQSETNVRVQNVPATVQEPRTMNTTGKIPHLPMLAVNCRVNWKFTYWWLL